MRVHRGLTRILPAWLAEGEVGHREVSWFHSCGLGVNCESRKCAELLQERKMGGNTCVFIGSIFPSERSIAVKVGLCGERTMTFLFSPPNGFVERSAVAAPFLVLPTKY